MAITRILLVRHGATTASAEEKFAGASDVDLSPEGLSQVRKLAGRLRNVRIDAAYCSPLKRAILTATTVAQPHGVTPVQLAALREIDHGHWEGIPHGQVEHQYAAEYAAWSADPFDTVIPGGESGRAVLDRALPAIEKIVADHAGQSVLVVSHKATNRLVIAALMGIDVRRYRDRLDQDLACINVLEFRAPADARLVVMNDAAHYDPDPTAKRG
jgi:probable phosphoglycerate mutase